MTRTILACIALLLMMAGQLDAQLLLGRAGASIATVGGDDTTGADSRTGLTGGAALVFPLSPTVGLEVGAFYTQKGATAAEPGVDVSFRLDYIELPVMLRMGLPTSTGAISPHFFVGGVVSFEANCEAEVSVPNTGRVTVECDAIGLFTRSPDYGAIFGGGLDIATGGPVSITLDVFHNFGLTTIDGTVNPGDIKNRSWSIMAGVAVDLQR